MSKKPYTPYMNRPHIAFFGETNAGKSTLFNAIIGQDAAIVSSVPGTTTDPVSRGMELLPYGPVVLIDTAGINDSGTLGEHRTRRTNKILERTDLALYLIDALKYSPQLYEEWQEIFSKRHIPYITVVTRADSRNTGSIIQAPSDTIYFSAENPESLERLKNVIIEKLIYLDKKEPDIPIIGDLIPSGSTVIMVAPIDSEAPKGRLILPQVQFIRDCLDHNIRCTVTNESQLAKALECDKSPSLVVTDSQIFKTVSNAVPDNIPLTSFSILLARQKGNIDTLYDGVMKIPSLVDGGRVLISEACSHNHSHDDIARKKIPAMLSGMTGRKLNFTFTGGLDFPEDLNYDLIIHCGGCMLTRRAMKNRILAAHTAGVPITNFGLVLAWGSGILDRAYQIIAGS